MSLLEALAEVVVGVSANKGGDGLVKRDGGLDSLFGGAQASPGKGGGLEDVLGAILGGQAGGGGGAGASGGQMGGLGGLLEQLAGGQGGSGGSGGAGGLEDLIGQLAGGAGGKSGGLGDLLGAVTGALGGGAAAAPASTPAPSGSESFGSVLNSAITNRGKSAEKPKPSASQEMAAGLMLRAMLQAAKADGKFDKDEQAKILDRLGDVSDAERQFVNSEMQKPIDIKALAGETPKGLEHQVYAMSVMGIDLDNQEEAQYLHGLAQAMQLDQQSVNHIHGKLGAPALYR